MKAAERRPRYYAAENARRRALADERRRVRRRRTANACPTKGRILEAWRRRRESHEAAMRFGGMMEDLECYLDNSLMRDEGGAIVGRNPGLGEAPAVEVVTASTACSTATRIEATSVLPGYGQTACLTRWFQTTEP